MQTEPPNGSEALSALSVATLTQVAEVERLVGEIQENIRAANVYAGRAPTPHHYWVNGPIDS